jgi:cytochrome c5
MKMMVIGTMTIFIASCSQKLKPAATATTPITPSTQVVQTTPTPVQQPVATEVKVENPTPASPANIADGKATFESKCGRCHALKSPADYDATRWVKLVDWMAPKAQLNDTEKANVIAYVQANAKQ